MAAEITIGGLELVLGFSQLADGSPNVGMALFASTFVFSLRRGRSSGRLGRRRSRRDGRRNGDNTQQKHCSTKFLQQVLSHGSTLLVVNVVTFFIRPFPSLGVESVVDCCHRPVFSGKPSSDGSILPGRWVESP